MELNFCTVSCCYELEYFFFFLKKKRKELLINIFMPACCSLLNFHFSMICDLKLENYWYEGIAVGSLICNILFLVRENSSSFCFCDPKLEKLECSSGECFLY